MKTKRFFQPLVLAGFLATGFIVVWGVVAVWALESFLAEEVQRGKTLVFQADGTPLVVQPDFRSGGSQYWNLEGNPVPRLDRESPPMMACCHLPVARTDPASGDNTDWEQRIRFFSNGRTPETHWFFVSDGRSNGSAYFVGYDKKSCRCIGYLGTAGFRTQALPAEELIPIGSGRPHGPREDVLTTQYFHGGGAVSDPYGYGSGGRAPPGYVSNDDVCVVGHDRRIYHADLQKRTMHFVLEDAQLCSAALVLGVPDPLRGTHHRLVARIAEEVFMLDASGRVLKRYPIPEPLRSLDLHFAEGTTGEAVMYWSSPFDELSTEVNYRIYWVALNGNFRQADITLPNCSELPALRAFGATVVPSPLVLGGLITTFGPWFLQQEGLAVTYGAALRRMLAALWPALMIAQLLAFGFAALCYRRQVRYRASPSERLVWSLFVLALGLPGWIAYRFGRSWPVLQACPECGVGVPQDRADCARCETDFPGAALKGTEVFA
jgi:hypothetical protein